MYSVQNNTGDYMKNKYLYLFALFIKFIPIGFAYRPLQDDYIQYYAYSRYDNIFETVIRKIGILNVRPFAGLADILVWGKMWDCMIIALIIITLLYWLSYLLLNTVFNTLGYNTGTGFAVIYLLCPIGFEACYWISASSRIIVSLFFVSLSLWCITQNRYILFILALTLSIGFYEQTAVTGAVMCIWVMYECKKYRINCGLKKYCIACVTLWTAIFIYYLIFAKTGSFASRSENISLSAENIFNTLYAVYDAWQSIKDVFAGGFTLGFLPAVLSASIAFLTVCGNIKNRDAKIANKIFMGNILFLTSYTVYFLFGNKFIPYRCHMPSLIGLGLITDAVINVFSETLGRIFLYILCFTFLTANMYQAECYREINEYDKIICEKISADIDETNKISDIYIYNAKDLYINVPQNYRRYILPNVTASDWSLTGAVRAFTRDLSVKKVIPINTGG